MMERVMFNDVWEDLKNENEESGRVFETAEAISKVIVSLIEARVDRGLTQRQLAQKCGLKQAAIARMESLKTIPRLDTVIKVASALDLSLDLSSKTVTISDISYNSESDKIPDFRYDVSMIDYTFLQNANIIQEVI